ncbi:MAG: SMP-30/Gluconolaconase/LRE-like region-containing protein [Phycisphaerales bacterium]|nr:SMP-30/Gluconolaconase/LRE-like region-containing protein [Phycisphaerales bacterium]
MGTSFARLACFSLLAISSLCSPLWAADDYVLGVDSQRHDGVPKGTVTPHKFVGSKIYPGTERDYWVYVPAQYDAKSPACVMVFEDGGGFQNDKGGYRVPVVFDNLIHKKEMPITIGVFVNPGVIPPAEGLPTGKGLNGTPASPLPRFNRSYEYDSPTDLNARFLVEELLPAATKDLNVVKDGNGRAICGASSGGIAAWVAAWERPNEFSRVVSFVGSFTNLRGGHDCASLIRKTEGKRIRAFLQDGSNDLDIYSGSWWVGNNDVMAALRYAGYEFQWVPGDGGHNGKHGGSVLPDAIRYVWKDYPAPVAKPTFAAAKDQRNVGGEILVAGEEWQAVAENLQGSEGPAADADGNVFFTEARAGKIHKIAPDGKVTPFADNPNGPDGAEFGPGHALYVACNKTNQIVRHAPDGKMEVVADGIMPNDLVVSHTGHVYVTDHKNHQVWHISPSGEKKVVDSGLTFPNGVVLTPDQSQLVVGDMKGPGLYAWQVHPDGSLSDKALYYFAQTPPNKSDCGADGLTVDRDGRLYAATPIGIQVFDQAGRVFAIINKPVPGKGVSSVAIGGPDLSYLYATAGDKVYRRKIKPKGVVFYQGPVVPEKPRL